MEGDFVLGYLGNSILSKATASGLGTIQKPLRDTYFEYKKTSGKKGKQKELTEVGLRVSPQGVYILVAGSHPGNNESFYDMPSISFFEAVKFKTVKGSDKKLQAGFLPIDINRSPNTGSEKLFTPLDKKYQSFAKMDHPAILALVMRRTTGVRALECHAFVCESEPQALAIVNMIGVLQERGADPRAMEYQGQGQNYAQYNPYSGPPRRPDIVENDFRDQHPIQRGDPRQTTLSDEHFRGGPNPPYGGWEGRDSDRYVGNDPRDMRPPKRDDHFAPPRGYGDVTRMVGGEDEVRYRHERQRSNEYGRGEDLTDRRSGDFRHERQRSSEHGRQDVFGDPRSGDFHHERQRSGEYNGDRRSGGPIVHERQRSGEITPRDPMRSSREVREFERQGRSETRQDEHFRIPRPMSPVRGPVTAPKPSRALSPGGFPRNDHYSDDRDFQQRPPLRTSRDEPISPRERGPPPPQGPEFSLSSLENRQETTNQSNKPVARVPPHLVAGVKVLPTGFMAALQQKQAGQKSPREERRDYDYREEEDPYDNAISRREFYKREARNAKSEGERFFDEPGKESRYVYHPPPDLLPPEERDRQKQKFSAQDLNDYDAVIRRDTNFNDQKGHNANYRYSAPSTDHVKENKPWSYDEQFQKYSKERDSDDLGRSGSRDDFRFYKASDGSGGRKAYEVQDQFSKMNINNQNRSGLDTAGTNFEESLGYFP